MPERLPIKVIKTVEHDFYSPGPVSGRVKKFGDVTPSVRKKLASQVQEIQAQFANVFAENPETPAVAKVHLKEEAFAKSYRPTQLFDEKTCPIIGVRNFGEILTTVTPSGLKELQARLLADERVISVANISTVKDIEPYTAEDAVPMGINALQEMIAGGLDTLKLKLFQHKDSRRDNALLRAFLETIEQLELEEPDEIRYADGLKIFSVKDVDERAAHALMNFVGTQSLSPFPSYFAVKTASSARERANFEDFSEPDPDIEYPVLGIIDSGIEPTDQILSPWITARTTYIIEAERDHSHGTFVGGLAVFAKQLNHNDSRFPEIATKIVDVTALPKTTVRIEEDAILQSITEAVVKHRDVRVWNLSLGSDAPCEDNTFSDFGMALDQLADEYDVQFVMAAGNYKKPPFRGWPPTSLGQKDRICSPADSVRGLTVGALAHKDNTNSLVKAEEPAPFSRKGPGPMFIPKPEVTHYGGNCNNVGNFSQTGILSFDGKGNIAEDIGTSFSCPLVSSTVSHVQNALSNPSKNLVKALVIHSALLNSERSKESEFPYRGFGIPSDVLSILSCSSNSCTLVFEADLLPGLDFRKENFPIPPCMRKADGSVVGEFLVTLVYDPPLDPTAGSEYCRSNVEVSLGTYDLGADGKRHHAKKIPIEAGDTKKREKTLVEHGFKWSPVKVYRRKIPNGIKGQDWCLKVELLTRSGFQLPTDYKQNMVVVVTMKGPDDDSPVYDEVVRLMNQGNWSVQNIQVQQRYRL